MMEEGEVPLASRLRVSTGQGTSSKGGWQILYKG